MMKKIFLLIIFACGIWSEALAQLTPDQHQKLVSTARWMGRMGIDYRDDWTPPDEKNDWEMDCSNTVRYLYRKALEKELPRTASDQYYILKQQNLVTEAPQSENGGVDTKALLGMLRSGDLLFWEWTYDIKRNPPITHVMIYLGQTKDGTPKMVGSSVRSLGDKHRRGGVDVYTFNPNAPMGGVKSFWGNYIHKGRFVGFGRPFSPSIVASSKKADEDNRNLP